MSIESLQSDNCFVMFSCEVLLYYQTCIIDGMLSLLPPGISASF